MPFFYNQISTSDFNPRSPCGERPANLDFFFLSHLFQPTLPVRGATDCGKVILEGVEFQPTLPVRGATLGRARRRHDLLISTHAPRAGSDFARMYCMSPRSNFNPRSPCGERHSTYQGLSTYKHYFNPRSPCGERPETYRINIRPFEISTHAPRAGSDSQVIYGRPLLLVISTHAPRAGSDSQGLKGL